MFQAYKMNIACYLCQIKSIKSSVPQFYWTLEFSLENDVKYLPDYLTCSSKFENSDTLYILNPYFS